MSAILIENQPCSFSWNDGKEVGETTRTITDNTFESAQSSVHQTCTINNTPQYIYINVSTTKDTSNSENK